MASKAAAAVLARIVDIAREHAPDIRSYVATAPSSTPILEEHIDVLSAPDGATASASAADAAVELSKLVDLVQNGEREFRGPGAGERFVTNVYRQVVHNVEFARAALLPEQEEIFRQAEAILYEDPPFARTEVYARFAQLRAEIASLAIDRAEGARAIQQADEAEREVLRSRIEALQLELAAKRELMEALDAAHSLSRAEEIYRSAQLSGFPEAYQRAHAMLGDPAFQIASPGKQSTHWPATFFPAHLAEENWIPLKVTRTDIADVSDEVLGRLPRLPHAANRVEFNDAAIDVIEFEVQILHVDRPWLWSGLFESRQWRFRTEADPLSDGAEPPSGQLPAFVTGLIFARNLRLSGQKAMVEDLTAARPVVGLGNFQFRPITATTAVAMRLRPEAAPLSAAGAHARPAAAVRGAPATVRFRHPMAARIALPENVVIRGRTVDESGQPLAAVTVTLRNVRSGLRSVSNSAQNGSVVFRLPEAGTYEMRAEKAGFTPFQGRMRLGPEGRFTTTLRSRVLAGATMLIPARAAQLAAMRAGAAAAVAKKTLTVELRKRTEEGTEEPLDVPAQIVVINERTKERHPLPSSPGSDAVFVLDAGRYRVAVHCAVYEPVGSTSRTINVRESARITFVFRPRTILQSEDTFLMGFLCYRTPRSPNPDENADFGR